MFVPIFLLALAPAKPVVFDVVYTDANRRVHVHSFDEAGAEVKPPSATPTFRYGDALYLDIWPRALEIHADGSLAFPQADEYIPPVTRGLLPNTLIVADTTITETRPRADRRPVRSWKMPAKVTALAAVQVRGDEFWLTSKDGPPYHPGNDDYVMVTTVVSTKTGKVAHRYVGSDVKFSPNGKLIGMLDTPHVGDGGLRISDRRTGKHLFRSEIYVVEYLLLNDRLVYLKSVDHGYSNYWIEMHIMSLATRRDLKAYTLFQRTPEVLALVKRS